MTTPIQSLVQTIAEYIHDVNAAPGDDVTERLNNIGMYVIDYSVGPDDNHETRTGRSFSLMVTDAKDVEQLVLDAWHAGWDAGFSDGAGEHE